MQTSYIYSVSRVNTLTQFLLSKTDIERLMVAKPGEDLQSALKETYLAPYVARVPEENVSLAIEQTLIDAKQLIQNIAPDHKMFRVLWMQYDMHNLRVFTKATSKRMSYEECIPYLSNRGTYEPSKMFTHIEEETLDELQSGWQKAYNTAVETVASGGLDIVDGIYDELYFETGKRIVKEVKDSFMKTYLSSLIDMFNLKSRLRHLQNDSVNFSPSFVKGGAFDQDQIETLEDVVQIFSRLGPTDFWKEALEFYQETGNFTRIDARSPEYLLEITKEASQDMFSSASLVLYYLKCRQAAANIRSIVVGRNSGFNEGDIRVNLRTLYVND